MLLHGEAGIGKTSLLQEFRSNHQARYHFAWGGCDALSTPLALGSLHDMSPELGHSIRTVLKTDPTLTKLLPALIQRLAESAQPVIMVFEDVHWADNATLDLIKCLGRRITLLSAMLIITFRPDEIDPRHPLTNLLGELPNAATHRIKVPAISPGGTAQLASDMGKSIDNLFAVTNGNPFYVTELLASDDWANESVPATIQDAIGSRLNRLPPREQTFLETLSTIPHSIDRTLINLLYPEDGELLAETCVQRNLLKEDGNGNYRFRHELARLGTKDRTSKLTQKANHQQIAEALQNDTTQRYIDQILYHAFEGRIAKLVLANAPIAAKSASASGAHAEAASHLSSALEFVAEAPPELAATLYESWSYEAGLIQIDNDVINARHSALAIWRTLGRTEKIGENLRWLSRLHWYHGHSDKANQYADEAISILESTDASAEQAMAYSLKSQFHMLNDRMEESILWGDKALEIEAKCNNAEVKIHALNNIGTAMVFRDDVTGLTHLNSSLELALKHGHHEHAARVYTNTADYAVGRRNFELAEKTISDGIVFDAQHDLDSWTHYLVGLLAQLRMKQGRLEEAETISQGVLKLDKLTLLMKLPALLVLARTQSRLGRPNATDTLDASLHDALSTGESQYILPARLGLIEAAWQSEKHDTAVNQIEAVLSSDIIISGTWRDSELAIWMNRYDIKHKKVTSVNLPQPYQLELNGQHRAAADTWQAIGSPYPAALALLTSPDSIDKTDHMTFAFKLLEGMYATGTLRRAARLANNLGISKSLPQKRKRPRTTSRKHPLGLTKKEQEILPLLIKGMSNKQISDEFVRSERTIENHVASIFRKLNVHSRMEAMLRAKNEPWLINDDQTETGSAAGSLSIEKHGNTISVA